MVSGISGEPIHTRCLAIAFTQGQGESVDQGGVLPRSDGAPQGAGRDTTGGRIRSGAQAGFRGAPRLHPYQHALSGAECLRLASARRDDRSPRAFRIADLFFAACDEDGSERLLSHDELRLFAEVDLAGWRLRNVGARERCREGPSCGDMPWQSRSEELRDFCGQSLGGGMTRFSLERFAGRDEDARLLSALLSLAPGMTQVGATLSDALVPSSSAHPGGMTSMGPGPCYMLRADGPLVETLFSLKPRDSALKPDG